jgi:hypothetical protein
MEETMRILAITELSRYWSTTLQGLEARTATAVAALPQGSAERDIAFANLRKCEAR